MLSTYVFQVSLCLIRTKRSGNVEQNPGPKPSSRKMLVKRGVPQGCVLWSLLFLTYLH